MQCVDPAPQTITSIGPLKKRRGRPPKYLNIWQEQHMFRKDMLLNVAPDVQRNPDKDGQENLMMPNLTPVLPHPGQSGHEKQKTNNQVVVKDEASDERPVTTTHSSQKGQTIPTQTSLSTPPELTQQTPTSTGTDSEKDEVKNTGRPVTATVLPMKRRPGRPPGSTKRVKIHHNLPTPLPQHQEFSLRKFFEAGGRDYNSYLEWLKQKSCQPKDAPTEVSLMPPLAPRLPQVVPQQTLVPHCLLTRNFVLPPSPAAATTPPALPRSQTALSPPGMSQQSPPVTARQPSNSPTSGACEMTSQSEMAIAKADAEQSVRSNGEVLDLSTKKVNGLSMTRNVNCTVENDTKCELYHRSHVGAERPLREWDVEEVQQFVKSIPGCLEYASLFKEHCIDGTALLHLSEEHLLNFVKMKLGPAIRLRLAISQVVATTT